MVASQERSRSKFFRPWEHSEELTHQSREEWHHKKYSHEKEREYLASINKTIKHRRQTEKCPVCEKEFTRKDNLTRHRKMKHESDSKPKCTFCNKQLSRKDAVQRHEGTCHNNPSKLCSPLSPNTTGNDSSSADSYYSHKPGYEASVIQMPIKPYPLMPLNPLTFLSFPVYRHRHQ